MFGQKDAIKTREEKILPTEPLDTPITIQPVATIIEEEKPSLQRSTVLTIDTKNYK